MYRIVRTLRDTDDVLVVRAVGPEGDVCLKAAKTPARAESLQREGALLARLEPLGGAALIDAGFGARAGRTFTPAEGGPLPFIAIRWIEGAPLETRAAPEVVRSVAEVIGDRLATLHALGVAHGDVKPENILLDEEGTPWLIDHGLASPSEATGLTGGTLRYLERDPRAPARSRDLFALGVTLAELEGVDVDAGDPATLARVEALSAGIGRIVSALVRSTASVRPDAVWIADCARGMRDRRRRRSGPRREGLVRATYVGARGVARIDGAPAWLGRMADMLDRVARLGPEPSSAPAAPPLDVASLRRWLGALVGPAATKWACARWVTLGEARLLERLEALAEELHPRCFTFRLVDAHLQGAPVAARADEARPLELALRLGRVPVDADALAAVERKPDVELDLALRAAELLRGLGQAGRAALLLAPFDDPRALAARAAFTRRAGDRAEAERLAILAEAQGQARGTAVRARLLFDRGDVDGALALVSGSLDADCAEVEALCAGARGRPRDGEAALDRVEGAIESVADRCRLAGVRGFVLAGHDAARALEQFRKAVDLAELSGSVEDEATYLTGMAASAVDVGAFTEGVAAADRAALLWGALGRNDMTARALLARAAAHAVAARRSEALTYAAEAAAVAEQVRDARAGAYALLVACDALEILDPARVGRLDVLARGDTLSEADRLRVAARLEAHRSLEASDALAFDALAARLAGDDAARLEWWTARARTATTREAAASAARQLVPLLGTAAPLHTIGRAAHAAVAIAEREGLVETATLHGLLRARAREAVLAAGPGFRDAVSRLAWVAAAPSDLGDLPAAQVGELDKIVRLLTSGERLGDLLARVVDALVLWTGAERGLLLSRAPDGTLVVRTARNTSRRSLAKEELFLSRSLALRAFESREPVVAIDALGESSPEQSSIHALRLRSVLAVPLVGRTEVLGVVYLDDRAKKGTFGERELGWVKSIAAVAAALIQSARAETEVRRANARERRALAAAERKLAEREARVDLVMRLDGGAPARARHNHPSIVGDSEPILKLLKLVDRVAAADVPVLVTGESGSGKELVARAIHASSSRSRAAFVSENTSAIPETLLESALFGHTRGAFTGADRTRVGLFEAADGGTLFLDEIGEMSLGMQAKLLRILEDGLVRPLGSERARKVDVRIIAATHRDLEQMVRAKTFREDLYYRLDIVSIAVPPLRERRGDVPALVAYFAAKYGKGTEFTREALAALTRFAFPGNVRQLENEVRRAIVLSDGVVGVEHLSPEIASAAPPGDEDTGLDVKKRVLSLERRVVREALEKTGGNQTRAAKLLGLSRFGLQKMMKRIDVPSR